MDFSNYPQDHPLYDPSNKAVLNKFKDECAGRVVKEFIGLRSKCYSILLQDGDTEKQKRRQLELKNIYKNHFTTNFIVRLLKVRMIYILHRKC